MSSTSSTVPAKDMSELAAMIESEIANDVAYFHEHGHFSESCHTPPPLVVFIEDQILSFDTLDAIGEMFLDFGKRFAAMGIHELRRRVSHVEDRGGNRFKASLTWEFIDAKGEVKKMASNTAFGRDLGPDFKIEMLYIPKPEFSAMPQWNAAMENTIAPSRPKTPLSGKLELDLIPEDHSADYPPPHHAVTQGRSIKHLHDAAGLNQLDAKMVTLQPGAKSALMHWHEHQDEMVIVTTGVCTLIHNAGEIDLETGECAAFPAGVDDAHTFVNRTNSPVSFVVIGPAADSQTVHYPDDDLLLETERRAKAYSRVDGSKL